MAGAGGVATAQHGDIGHRFETVGDRRSAIPARAIFRALRRTLIVPRRICSGGVGQ
jgi:hypothetical protein